MFKRLLQAATITFLLNLLAYINRPEANQPNAVLSSPINPKLVLNFR
jgi:hypothetical protein